MVPEDLVLNNIVQITYDEVWPKAEAVEYDAPAVLDDTKFVPLIPRGSFVPDVEFVLNAFFDVSLVITISALRSLMGQTYDDGTNRASCGSISPCPAKHTQEYSQQRDLPDASYAYYFHRSQYGQ